MSFPNIDIVSAIIMAARLHCRAVRAEAEIQTHESRFEQAETLLKLIGDTRRSIARLASTANRDIFSGWDNWIESRIIHSERVLSEIREAVLRRSGGGERSRTILEKLAWVLKHKDVAENLGVRLDQCYATLLTIALILAVAICGAGGSSIVTLDPSMTSENIYSPLTYNNNDNTLEIAHSPDHPRIFYQPSRSSSGFSSIIPPQNSPLEEQDDDDEMMLKWLRENRRDSMKEAEDMIRELD